MTSVSSPQATAETRSERPLRVLHAVPSYYPAFVYGGPIFSIHMLAGGLAIQGLDVSVATTNANGTTKLDVPTDRPVVFAPRYAVHYYDDTIIGRYSWDFSKHLMGDMRTADVVHLHDIYSTYALITAAFAWLLKKPLVISPRGSFSQWALTAKRPWVKSIWLKCLYLPFTRNPRRVAWHATSNAERDETLQVAGANAQVHTVPNGMDFRPFRDAPRPDRGTYAARFLPAGSTLPAGARVLVALGRIHVKKSFDTAIRALAALGPEHASDVLLIAGSDDGAMTDLMALARDLGLQNRVFFTGELKGEDKIAFLKGADLFVFPTHNENFGMSCLEALAAGLPTVASRNAPWEEVETHNAGRWVDNTPGAFASAISDICKSDPAHASANAMRLAEAYDIPAVAQQMARVYAGMVHD